MKKYVINPERNDGFGAQYQSIIFTALFSELKNFGFAYRPFTEMEHNYDEDPNFLEKKEDLINLIEIFENYKSIKNSQIENFELSRIYSEVENNLDSCVDFEIFKKIKDSFFSNKNLEKKNDGKNVCIHIRRPNKFDIGSYGYTEDEYFMNVLDEIIKNYTDVSKIKIYSQGKISQFINFKKYDIEYHLNESIEKTFTDLVLSDILVLSKGSFSYCAGLLNEGIVYYLPFWHKPIKKWLILK